jgi:hypothetical protein
MNTLIAATAIGRGPRPGPRPGEKRSADVGERALGT